MLKRIKGFFDKDVPEIKAQLSLLTAPRKEESTNAALMRHLLGSIDLSDVKALPFKDAERKDFAATIGIAYPKMERVINQLIAEHKDFALTHDGDRVFQEGTLNGFYIALEAFQEWRDEHQENTKPKEDFDPHTTLPELLERVSRAAGFPTNPHEERST